MSGIKNVWEWFAGSGIRISRYREQLFIEFDDDYLTSPLDHTHQSPGSGVGGKLDHGLALDGLSDDDHTQYFNSARHTKIVHDALGIDAATLGGNAPAIFEEVANKGTPNGYAPLDADSKVPVINLPLLEFPELIGTDDIEDFAITASKISTKIPILTGDSWTDNSPSSGYVAWNAHTLYYNGVAYSISAGNTNKKYIYWLNAGTSYTTSDTNPTLGDGDFVIAVNISGTHDLAWNAIANQVIGSAYIQDGAILNAKIGDLQVDTGKIADLAVDTGKIANLAVESAQIADLTVGTAKAAYFMASRGVQYVNYAGLFLSDTTETEIGSLIATTFETTDSVWFWANVVISQTALASAKGATPIPIFFRIRRDSLTGIELACEVATGANASIGELTPITLIGTDLPSTITPADQCAGGTPSADSEFGAGYEATKAFDDNLGTSWVTTSTACPHWIRYQFGSGKVIIQYSIYPRTGYLDYSPKDFKLQGSNNGSSWTDIDSRTGITDWVAGVRKYFACTNSVSYTYYQIYITAVNGGASGLANITEVEMFIAGTPGSVTYKFTAQAYQTPDSQSGGVHHITFMAQAKSR